MTPEQEIQRAGEAEQIINAPLFVEAKGFVLAQLADARRIVPMTATDMHTRLILAEQLAGYFFDYFKQISDTGKMARMKLEEQSRAKQFMEQGVATFRQFGRNF